MEFSDLLKVAENQVFIVADDFRWFGIFNGFNVFLNHAG